MSDIEILLIALISIYRQCKLSSAFLQITKGLKLNFDTTFSPNTGWDFHLCLYQQLFCSLQHVVEAELAGFVFTARKVAR